MMNKKGRAAFFWIILEQINIYFKYVLNVTVYTYVCMFVWV